MHAAIQRYVDDNLLAGVASVVLKDNEIIDTKTWGYMDVESRKEIRSDTIYRIYSNTKIITSVAAMCLWEDGCFDLDDPIEVHLPALADRQVLKEGATDPTETEPAKSRPTVRQLMCHNAGFSYGIFMESPVDAIYNERNLTAPNNTLANMVEQLADIPLASQPGKRWQYSLSTDILARLVEVWSARTFVEFLKERIFEPLDMQDTDFHVPESKHARLASNYVPVDPMDPMKPGLNKSADQILGSLLEPRPFTSGGGGLVSTIGDYTNFIRMLIGEGEWDGTRILAPETVRMMHTNQLPESVQVQLPNWYMPDTVFGLGLAIKTAPRDGEPPEAIDEFHWGGIAGTHSFIAPRANLAAIVFTQRLPGFWHPYYHEYKRLVYQAVVNDEGNP